MLQEGPEVPAWPGTEGAIWKRDDDDMRENYVPEF